ncbi:MAG: hypothetical protein ACTSPY_10950 [Candidatus Helarchaeota archaeon]
MHKKNNDYILADIVINMVLELQKIISLNVNEIDRFMTYQFKTNKGILQYREELMDNIDLLDKNNFEKNKIKKTLYNYCNALELLYHLNHIFLSLKLHDILNNENNSLSMEIANYRKNLELKINQSKDIIKYNLFILLHKSPDFYI